MNFIGSILCLCTFRWFVFRDILIKKALFLCPKQIQTKKVNCTYSKKRRILIFYITELYDFVDDLNLSWPPCTRYSLNIYKSLDIKDKVCSKFCKKGFLIFVYFTAGNLSKCMRCFAKR